MNFDELIILLPCHGFDDLPLHHKGEWADGLLACWTALWHPALLASAQAMPSHRRGEDPFETLTHKLIVVPQMSEDALPTDFAVRAEKEGGCLIRHQADRGAILAAAFDCLDDGDAGVDAELAADFLALGYCFLQVELLTRRMHYSSTLSDNHFPEKLLSAANAAVKAGNVREAVDAARVELQLCFDTLADERNRYCPVDPFIVDLTLVAPSTMGASLRAELAAGLPCNLLLSADTIGRMARQQPASLEMVRDAVQRQQVCLLGGGYDEPEFPLMSAEQILGNLRSGAAIFRQHVGRAPTVFGRRRSGLTPILPQLLKKLGFVGALHATLDDGRFPESERPRTLWQGLDRTELNAVAKAPLDAGLPETFLKLCDTLHDYLQHMDHMDYGEHMNYGEYVDTDRVPVVLLAHWPGKASPWYEDLRRITRFVPVLGTMTTFEQLFHETLPAGYPDSFTFDQYTTPYLVQAVAQDEPDPISRHVQGTRRRARAEACQALKTLADLVTGRADTHVIPLLEQLDKPHDPPALDGQIELDLEQTAAALAERIPRVSDGPAGGYLVLNPMSYARRMGLELPAPDRLPAIEQPVLVAGQSHGRAQAVVDVPAMGFAWIAATNRGGGARRMTKPVAEENVLQNEYIQAKINPETGSLQSIHDNQTRGNRFSQQLAYRGSEAASQGGDSPGASEEHAGYSVMAADAVEVTASNPALGEITTRGRLLSREGTPLATFTQVYQLWQGSRVLWVTIDLQPRIEPAADPWNSYFACRFAWPESLADLYRSMHGCRRRTFARRLEAPDFVEISLGDERTAIFSGGLPYHRRVGPQMLDTLLIVRGETARRFRLGMGFDVPHPHRQAGSMHVDPMLLEQSAGPPAAGSTAWLFHIDKKNVVATRWEPLIENQRAVGYRVRLLETCGRKTTAEVRSFRDVASARLVDFLGQPLQDCDVKQDAVVVHLEPFHWLELEARWP